MRILPSIKASHKVTLSAPGTMLLASCLILLQLFSATMAANGSREAPRNLNVTAISAANGVSTIECWKLTAPFAVSSEPGTIGVATAQLGKTGNLSYAIIPANYDGGMHNAPRVQ